MNKCLWLAAFLMAAIIASGCGPARYDVRVNGYTDPTAPAGLAPGGAFFIMSNKDAKNPLLDKEVQEKIGRLLVKQNYRLVPYEQAEYLLFFNYGLGGERPTVVLPDYYPYAGFGFGGGYWGRGSSVYWGGPFFSFPFGAEAVALYDRWLLLKVVDAKTYREKGQQQQTLWVGEARSTGTSTDLRTSLNYLLLAAFQKFGQNTGQAVTLTISQPEVQVFGATPPK
jgi:hypothetical protein